MNNVKLPDAEPVNEFFQMVTTEIQKGAVLRPDEFEVISVLGTGSFGKVSRVRHRTTNLEMAQKEIHFQAEEKISKQICQELRILRTSKCSAIIQFYGSAFVGDKVYIYMELMETSIDRVKQPITEEFLRDVARGVLTATCYLKANLSIMHRDLKPSNILVNSKGEIKLCDFGISGELVNSLAKTLVGCILYMAPERVDPSTSANPYSIKSDVWSLGITLLELANGAHPFSSNDVVGSMTKILKGMVPPLKKNFSPAAQNFVSRCLVKDIADRPDYNDLLSDPWITTGDE